jgi:hypothetical protein
MKRAPNNLMVKDEGCLLCLRRKTRIHPNETSLLFLPCSVSGGDGRRVERHSKSTICLLTK